MGWQDDPVVGADQPNTSVPLDQLQAQGYKYTPDQMAAFDRGRGQILAEETQSNNPPVPKEINYLNPTQKLGFDMGMDPATPTPAPTSGAMPWDKDPVVTSPLTKINDFLDRYTGHKLVSDEGVLHDLGRAGKELGGMGAGMIDFLTWLPRAIASGAVGAVATPFVGTSKAADIINKGMTASSLSDSPLLDKDYKKGSEIFNMPLSLAQDFIKWAQNNGAEAQLTKAMSTVNEAKKKPGMFSGALNDTVNDVFNENVGPLLTLFLLHKGSESLVGKVNPENARNTTLYNAPTEPASPVGSRPITGDTAVDSILGGTKPTTPPMFTLKGKPVDKSMAGDLEGVNTTPEEMTAEFAARQPGFNFDPLQRGETADLFDNNNSIRESQPVPPDITPTPDEMQARRSIDPAQAGEIPTDQIPTREAPVTPEDVRAAEGQGNLTTTYPGGASPYEPMKPLPEQLKLPSEGTSGAAPTTPLQKFLARRNQRGAVGDLGDAQRLDVLLKSLLTTDRGREGIKAGDTVRLMNGKVGKVTKVTEDGRYQIRHDDGSFDSVPVQGINYKYKPANQVVNAVGYPKARPLGAGPGNKQRGAINLGAFWSKKPKATTSDSGLEPTEPTDVKIPLTEEAKVDMIYRMYDRSQNVDDFRDALRLVRKRNSFFPQEAVDMAPELWNKFEEGYRPERSTYSSLSSMNQRDTIALRTVEQALKEIQVRGRSMQDVKLKDSDDLGYASKEFMSPMHIITQNWNKAAGKLYATIHGQLTDITAMWADKLGELMKHNKPYMKLDRKSQIAVDRAEEFWDNHQVLQDRQMMWPTKDMLMDKNFTNLSDAEANAYLEHANGYMEGYKAAGIERPPIPGYMPHTWQGAWRLNIRGPEGLVRVERTNFKWQAKKLSEEWKKKGYTVDMVEPQVSSKGDYIRVLEESLQQANRYGKAGIGVAKRIERELMQTLEGTITESMERRGIDGFIKNKVPDNFNVAHPLDSIMSMAKTRMNNNIRSGLFEKAMNDFARAGRNRQIIEAVAHPFYKNVANMRQAARLIDSVSDLISVSTGMRKQEYSAPDRWARQVLTSVGLPADGLRNFIQAANAFARIQRINSANLGFTAEHMYFGLPGIIDLRRMDLDRAANGERRGNYLKALGTFGGDFVTFGTMRSKEGKFAEKWARDNGVYGGHYYDEPEFKTAAGKVVGYATHGALKLVVNRMKAVNFHMAYNYFKDIMPASEALQAAKQHTKKVMQSFDPLDRPEIFNEGTAGIAIRTFNQIKLYNLGRIGEMLGSIKDAVQKGDYVTAANHFVNLVAFAALFTALGGAAGIPFHEDWEWLRKKGEENFPMLSIGGQSVWQSYEELMARAGIPNFVTFGMLPKLTGMDTRHTFEINVSNVFSGAGVESATAFASLVMNKIFGWATGKENPETTYKNIKKLLPTTAIPWLEDYEAKKLSGNIPNSRLEPTSPRSDIEDLIYKTTSKRATSESERNEIQSLLKDIDARNTKIREAYVDTIVKKMTGFDTGSKDVNGLIDDAIKHNIGFNIDNLSEQIVQKIKNEHISEATKYILEAANGDNTNQKANRFRNMKMLLQGERLGK